MTRYTAEQLEFLRREFPRRSMADLTAAFNAAFGTDKTTSQIKGTLNNHSIRCGRTRGELKKGKLIAWTPEQFEWLKREYRRKSLSELTTAFNDRFGTTKTSNQVRACLRNHRIRSGRSGHFTPGQTSWNAGTKGVMKANSGSFTPGSTPPNLRQLGAERLSKDGYIEVKVAERDPYTGHATRFRLKHQVVWERAHGPVPPGMMLHFKNHDRTDCRLENLELITRAERAILNKLQYTQLPETLKPSARLLAKLYTRRHELSQQEAS